MHSCPAEDDEGDDNEEFSSHSTGSDGNANNEPSSPYKPILFVGSAGLTERISAQTGGKTKYKHQMMEKYMRDSSTAKTTSQQGTQLNKWLESAAKFTPDRNNYHIEWNMTR